MQREKALLAFPAFATKEVHQLLVSWISIDKSSGSDSLYGELENGTTNTPLHCKCKEPAWTKEPGCPDFTPKAAICGNASATQVLKQTFFLLTHRNHMYLLPEWSKYISWTLNKK